jgi:hypothetical protein
VPPGLRAASERRLPGAAFRRPALGAPLDAGLIADTFLRRQVVAHAGRFLVSSVCSYKIFVVPMEGRQGAKFMSGT